MIKTWYNMTAATGEKPEAEISIYGPIGGFDINAKDFAEDLKAIDADVIHLRVDSPGGSVIDGNSIYNALTRHKAKIITHIDGLAASMGSVVAMAGDEIHMADNALLMIHEPWTVTMGNADELRADADKLDKMSGGILRAYSRSQYKEDEIKDLMKAETWLTAQEALDAGFIDQIEGGFRAAASIVDMAQGFEHVVPTDKIIASMTNKMAAVEKSRDEIKAQLVAQSQELVDARAEVEAAEFAKAEAAALIDVAQGQLEQAKAEAEEAQAAVLAAKVVTDEAIAQRAAEIMQTSSHSPVADHGKDDGDLSDTDMLAKYNALTEQEARLNFYKQNKTQILRAMTRQF
jgi:ATP-dependent Clp protease protease subunit